MRISDWSSDVCSSDLQVPQLFSAESALTPAWPTTDIRAPRRPAALQAPPTLPHPCVARPAWPCTSRSWVCDSASGARSEEHTSELQSLMRNSYAVFCVKKKKQHKIKTKHLYTITY